MVTQTKEKQIVIKAVEDLGRSVTAADVAAKTGLPLAVTTSELNRIASEVDGHLAVSTTGDIAYRFGFGFQTAYLAKGFAKVMNQIFSTLFSVGYYLLRISFGIMLIISFIIVFLLVIGVLIYLSRGNDRDGDREFSFGFFDYLILRDLFYWGAYSSYPAQIGYDRPTTRARQDGNFLLNCFSFLFGDGNPNLNLSERRWQSIAQVIKANNGTVTAEQLAPYTDADPQNEDGVLPVLVRFDGKPEVTENGSIIYSFPSMQVSAAQREQEKSREGASFEEYRSRIIYSPHPLYVPESRVPVFLKEYPWQFTSASFGALIPVYILAGLNFFGSWWLFSQTASIPFLMYFAPLLTVLVIYGSLFVLLPTTRWFVIRWLNLRIDKRNERRKEYALTLQNPTNELALKLKEAQELKIKEKLITSSDVVYTTDKDALEQEFDASP